MMRQAGRYQASYRKLAERHPDFRERSETADLIVEITLQPWESFQPDGLILFSDILTPLPALGVPFEIDDAKGPILDQTIRSLDATKVLHSIDLDQLHFVGDALRTLRQEADAKGTAVLGFIGCPWTMATYVVEGASSTYYKTIKTMMAQDPDTLDKILSHLAAELATYMCYQIEAGAQAVQMFDSWGGQLPPHLWDRWSRPYIESMVRFVKAKYPKVPLTLYVNNSGGLIERMAATGIDTLGLDWTVDLADARKRTQDRVTIQGNVDPLVLFGDQKGVEDAVLTNLRKGATGKGHVLNLGHGVMVGTPEENVKHFFDYNRSITYEKLRKM
jgi:uroporphyrinogen decarboxylase